MHFPECANVRVMWRMSPSTMHYPNFPHICNLYANIMLHIVHGFFVWNGNKKITLASKVIEKSPFLLYARYSQTLKRIITLYQNLNPTHNITRVIASHATPSYRYTYVVDTYICAFMFGKSYPEAIKICKIENRYCV